MWARIGPGSPRELLENPRIRAWHEARALRSPFLADTDLGKLRLMLHRLKLDPESVVELARADPDALGERLLRYASERKRERMVDDSIAKTFSGLGSYPRFRRIAFKGFPVMNPIRGSTLGQERVPTPEELGRILDQFSLRNPSQPLPGTEG